MIAVFSVRTAPSVFSAAADCCIVGAEIAYEDPQRATRQAQFAMIRDYLRNKAVQGLLTVTNMRCLRLATPAYRFILIFFAKRKQRKCN